MKTLYESILSSTRSGLGGLVKEVKEWLLSIYSINREKIEINDVDIKPGPKNSWKVFFNTGEKARFPSITISKYNLRDGIIPYDIYSINENGKPIDISYQTLQFDNEKDFIKEVRYKLNFSGCYINKISGIPNGCKILSFACFSYKPTHVEKIENININAIQCFHGKSSGCGLEIYLNKIKNCKINEFIHIGEDMLCISGSALIGGKEFSPLAQKVLEEFFKSNDVKPENCRFFPNPSKTKVKYRFGTIKYSKIKKKYIFKGEE